MVCWCLRMLFCSEKTLRATALVRVSRSCCDGTPSALWTESCGSASPPCLTSYDHFKSRFSRQSRQGSNTCSNGLSRASIRSSQYGLMCRACPLNRAEAEGLNTHKRAIQLLPQFIYKDTRRRRPKDLLSVPKQRIWRPQ